MTATSTPSPAPRPPATSGTASASSTRRCRAGGCGSSTPRIVWAIGYWIVYPAWPLVTSLHQGRARLAVARRRSTTDLDGAARRSAAPMVGQLAAASLRGDPSRTRSCSPSPVRRARPAFGDNCAPCHGRAAAAPKGYPEPERRRLDLGRHARRDPADHPARHPLERCRCAAGAGMPAFGTDGIARSAPRSPTSPSMCVTLAGLPAGREGRSRRGQEALRRQLRRLPRRRRQGQPRSRRAEPDRRRSGSTAATDKAIDGRRHHRTAAAA